jgi:hypothetical protein
MVSPTKEDRNGSNFTSLSQNEEFNIGRDFGENL